MEDFNKFKEEKLRKIFDLSSRWNDKFLFDMKEIWRGRILFIQNITTLIIGLFAAGLFTDSLKGLYGIIGFIFAFVTIIFIVLYLRESLDGNEESELKLFAYQEKLYNKMDNILHISENKEHYNSLIAGLEKDIEDDGNNKKPLLDCSGEFINFLFISTLTFLALSFFEIEFKYCYLVGVILVSLLISFLKFFHFIILPFRYVLTKVKRFNSHK